MKHAVGLLAAVLLVAPGGVLAQSSPQLLRPGTIPLQTYAYTAGVADPGFSGRVAIPGLTWTCAKGHCRVRAPFATATVAACAVLAAKTGPLTSFGHPGSKLDAAGLAECNRGTRRVERVAVQTAPTRIAVLPPASRGPTQPQVAVAPAGSRALVPAGSPALRNAISQRDRLFESFRLQREQETAAARRAAERAAGTPPPGYVKHGQGSDCDDTRRDVHPLAAEVCDHRDNNCDGHVDENQLLSFFLDADGDTHGDPSRRVEACPDDQQRATDAGEWLVPVGNDCDDADPEIWRNCP